MKKVYLTEAQVKRLVLNESSQILCKVLKEEKTSKSLKDKIKSLLVKGVSVAAIAAALTNSHNLGHSDAEMFVDKLKDEIFAKYEEYHRKPKWELVASDVIATVYNAEPKQCNKDVTNTASMFRLNLKDVLSHRIIAMERTMMAEFGFEYGDVVKIEGTGKWDGIWQIQDTMNKRFAGQHKIDILIPKSAGLGEWKNVKVYRLENPEHAIGVKDDMAPQLTRTQAKKQLEQLQAGKNFNV